MLYSHQYRQQFYSKLYTLRNFSKNHYVGLWLHQNCKSRYVSFRGLELFPRDICQYSLTFQCFFDPFLARGRRAFRYQRFFYILNSRYEMLHIVTKNSEKSRNIAGNIYRRIIAGQCDVRKSRPPSPGPPSNQWGSKQP